MEFIQFKKKKKKNLYLFLMGGDANALMPGLSFVCDINFEVIFLVNFPWESVYTVHCLQHSFLT